MINTKSSFTSPVTIKVMTAKLNEQAAEAKNNTPQQTQMKLATVDEIVSLRSQDTLTPTDYPDQNDGSSKKYLIDTPSPQTAIPQNKKRLKLGAKRHSLHSDEEDIAPKLGSGEFQSGEFNWKMM